MATWCKEHGFNCPGGIHSWQVEIDPSQDDPAAPDPCDNDTIAITEGRLVVLPQIRPLPGRTYNWIDLSLRSIPDGWTAATPEDIDGGEVGCGTMQLVWRANDEVLKAQAAEAQRVLDSLPHPAKPIVEADSLEAAMAILAERFKLVPFDIDHFGWGKDGVGRFDYPGVDAPTEIRSDEELLFLSERRCVADWLARVLKFAEGKSTIYWRIEPELEEIEVGRHPAGDGCLLAHAPAYRIYSRLSVA